ncbi:AAA family ATPase [Bacillus solitudinis]|uniref:hypothetical protein n=1 Tax=Bacillus solitudinis TaxID=2014074 RepID=UPI000C2373F2|nr:hypothetical protein [Bacillus solitudinis]
MIEVLNQELKVAKEKLWKKRKYQEHFNRMSSHLKEEQKKTVKLKEQLKKEQQDVERLEGLSVANLFYSLTGRKLEKVDKEKRELIAVELKYQEATKTIEDVTHELETLKQKLLSVTDAEPMYEELLKKKETLIHSHDSLLSEELYHLVDLEAELSASLKEYDEALSAGKQARGSLERALESLHKAQGWSTWDMIGGGAISTAIKHSHMDDSRDEIHQAQRELRLFQEELQDVNNHAKANLDIGGFLTFADYFFDGFIVDWFVHGHIQDSHEHASTTLKQTNDILNKLHKQKESVRNKLLKTEQERIKFVEQIS